MDGFVDEGEMSKCCQKGEGASSSKIHRKKKVNSHLFFLSTNEKSPQKQNPFPSVFCENVEISTPFSSLSCLRFPSHFIKQHPQNSNGYSIIAKKKTNYTELPLYRISVSRWVQVLPVLAEKDPFCCCPYF